ncbi:tripartite tricarboxylate transporter substrate-binding protein [Mycobacterium sp. NPDC003323]
MAMSATRSLAALAAAAALVLTACDGSRADASVHASGTWPAETVELLVGHTVGGSSDVIGRAVAKGLSADLDVPVRVSNRGGGNGAVAAAQVAAAPADGSVIAIENASLYVLTPLAVGPDQASHIADVDVVYGISSEDYVLVANPANGFRTIDELQRTDRTVRYGTAGAGTGSQLAGALLMQGAGVTAEPVPFAGGAPNLAAVLADDVDVAVVHVGEAIENIRSAKLMPLAVFSPERIRYLPEVPTATELGFDVTVSQYRFLTAPKGTSEAVKGALIAGLKATFATGSYQRFN